MVAQAKTRTHRITASFTFFSLFLKSIFSYKIGHIFRDSFRNFASHTPVNFALLEENTVFKSCSILPALSFVLWCVKCFVFIMYKQIVPSEI